MIQIRTEVLAAAVLGVALGLLVAAGDRSRAIFVPGQTLPEGPLPEPEAPSGQRANTEDAYCKSRQGAVDGAELPRASSGWKVVVKWVLRVLLVVLSGLAQ